MNSTLARIALDNAIMRIVGAAFKIGIFVLFIIAIV